MLNTRINAPASRENITRIFMLFRIALKMFARREIVAK
jgi:hypothetical protein